MAYFENQSTEQVEANIAELYNAGAFTVATVPAAASNVGRVIYVSDGSEGSACAAISDGTNWKVIALGSNIASS